MPKWLIPGALVAFAAAAALAGSDAEAGNRLRFHYAPFYDMYDPGPEWMPPPRYYYYFDEPEPDRFYQYDESYYEPKYLGRDDQAVSLVPRKKSNSAMTPGPGAAKKKTAAVKASTAETQPKSTAALSCDKATAIVSGYGFASVKAEDCEGQVYAFAATRDGKAYAIRLSARSGELTEVKKLQ